MKEGFSVVRLGRLASRSRLMCTSLAITVPIVAFLTNESLRAKLEPTFEPAMTAAVAVVCWFCGPVYATASLILSAGLFVYFFLPPYYGFAIYDLNAALKFCFFLGANGLIVALISNLYRAQAAITRSERIYRNFAELIPFGGWIADGKGNMLYLSESFLNTFGLDAESALGLGWTKSVVPEQRAQVTAEWTACARQSYFWDYEYRMTSRTGEVLSILSRGVPVGEGPDRTWVGMHLDVTQRERSLEEQVRQARDIARFNAELEQLAYVSAHDLQEPLRMIASYVQLLQRRYAGRLDAEADEYIGYAVEGASRLRSLLEDLLQLQNVGKSNRPRARHSLREIVDRAIGNLGQSARDARIETGALPDVVCEEQEFTRLFEHLIGNAVKYRRAEEPSVVRINASPAQGGGWTICVTDNGIGIAPQYRRRIFDVFQRLHSRSDYPGTGIGLAICRKIVEVHGGRIWVDDVPSGPGSRFCFSIPAEG